jgi:Tol biopolymer transport system component
LGEHELWTMPSIGGEAKARLTISKDERFLSSAWSPDGKAIADVRAPINSRTGILETRNLETGETHTLLTDDSGSLVGRGACSVFWLPSGRIVFQLFKSGSTDSDLWVLTLNSAGYAVGKPSRITNTTGLYVVGLSASNDGKRLAIQYSRESSSIFVANLSKTGDELEQPRRLTNDYWSYNPSCWTADSQALFLNVEPNDQGQMKSSIYRRRMSSDSAEVFLTGSENYSAWSLSPDGTWVIATANRRVPGKGRLLRIPLSGGTPEKIVDLSGLYGQVHCAAAGYRSCLMSEDIGKQQVFSMLDPPMDVEKK